MKQKINPTIPANSSNIKNGSKSFNSLLKAERKNTQMTKHQETIKNTNEIYMKTWRTLFDKRMEPSNASSNSSTITLLLSFGRNFLDHHSWPVERTLWIGLRHCFSAKGRDKEILMCLEQVIDKFHEKRVGVRISQEMMKLIVRAYIYIYNYSCCL